ncbi:hypothetical protein [Polaromonas hydrogenivorans]|uniref:DUF4149 domain-containing protein n=1 Tax=Polaromonas hydrogenivorans TaxID=335476 RepID=A0AAU7LV59_9BURK
MIRIISVRLWGFRLAGFFCILSSVYCFMGVLQAASLFTGERALFNGNLWASLSLLFGVCAIHLFSAARPSTCRGSQRVTKFLALFWAAISLAAAWQVVAHLLAVDRCLDQGASFDYVRGECDLANPHNVISLGKTHGFLLVAALLAAVHSALAFWKSNEVSLSSNNAL